MSDDDPVVRCLDCATPMTGGDWSEFSSQAAWLGQAMWRCGCKGERGLTIAIALASQVTGEAS